MLSLNVRLLAIIVGLGVILTISTFALNRFQVYRQADFYYKAAQKTRDSDDIEQRLDAVKNLRRYVGLRPDNNDVRAELGELMVNIAKNGGPEHHGFYASAFFILEKVLHDSYTRSDVRRILVEVAIITRRYSDAKDHLDVLLEDKPNDAELLTWLGQCQAMADENKLAKASFKKAIENDPGRIEPYALLVAILQKQKGIDLSGDRNLNPTVMVPVVKAGSSVALQTPDPAMTDETKPDDNEAGETKIEVEKPDPTTKEDTKPEAPKPDDEKKGTEPADEKKDDDKPGGNVEEILIEKEDENHPDTWMNRMVEANSDSSQAYLTRGKYLLRTRKTDEAEEDISAALRKMPLEMRKVGGALGQTSKALRELIESLSSAPDSAKAAIEKLDSAAKQMQTPPTSTAALSQSEESSVAEKSISAALKSTTQALTATGEALGAITNEKDQNDYIVEMRRDVTTAKDKVVSELGVLHESLRGALLLLSECKANKGESDYARRLATRAYAFFPNSAPTYALLSRLASREDNQQQAREWIELGLDATDESPRLLWLKANYLIDDLSEVANQGQEKRDSILETLVLISDKLRSSPTRYQSPAFMGYLSARTAFAQRQWAKATKEFEPHRASLARMAPRLVVKGDQMVAACYNHLGRPELVRDVRRRSIGVPGPIATRFGKIARMLSEGNLEEAITEFYKMKEAGDLPDDAWIQLAENNLAINRRREKTKQDWDTFNMVFQEAKKSNPEDARLPRIAADAWIAQEKMDEAQKILAEACKKNPKELQYWRYIISIARQKEDWEEAEKLLLDARNEFGDIVALRIGEAFLIIDRDKKESSPALKQLAENTDQYSDQDRVRLLGVLATCAMQADDLELAQQLCRKAADGDPTHLKLRIFLFEIAHQKKDDTAMAEAVKEIHEIEEEGPFWHFHEALRLAVKAEKDKDMSLLDKSLSHLARAKVLRPNWERIPMLAGRIELRKGNKKAAIDNFRDAVELGSLDSQGIGALVTLLYERGQNDEAQRMIDLLEEQDAQISTQAKRWQAQAMFNRGEEEKGLENLRKIAKNSENFRDHLQLGLRLGRILGVFGRQAQLEKDDKRSKELFDNAEKSLHKAIELAPNETSVWLAMVEFLSRSGKESEALAVISEARKTVDKQRLPLTLARCFQSLGRGPEAEQQYLTAVSNSDGKDSAARLLTTFYLQNKKSKEADNILKQIIDGKQSASEFDIAWARRRMALLLYSRGGPDKRRDAIALIDENLKKDPSSTNDIRHKAKFLATSGNQKKLRESSKLIERLLSQTNPNPDDRLLMARVRLALGDWPGVTGQMRQLLSSKNVKPHWLFFYINSLLNRNEFSSAEAYLKHLERIDPNTFAIIQFKVCILTSHDQYDRALEILDKYVNNPSLAGLDIQSKKEADRQKVSRLGYAATTLNNMIDRLPRTEKGSDPKQLAGAKKYTKRNETYWREIAKLHPAGPLRLVRFLGQHGKRDEALTLAETAWKQGNPTSIATTAVSLIIKGKTTPEEIKRVEQIINDAISTFGETNSLLLAMAELRSLQRRYEEAESLYRKVLDKNPRSVVALNNLAVFLALRNVKVDESLELINKAITIADLKPVLLDSRASTHISRGDWESALADLDTAISLKPTPTRLFHQAQALYAAKQKDKAAVAFKRAHDLGLNEDKLQPLERSAYRQLREDLK